MDAQFPSASRDLRRRWVCYGRSTDPCNSAAVATHLPFLPQFDADCASTPLEEHPPF